MGELISIIVPVYNLENYIEKCITSIMRQSYANWELILVDDGSTDNSGQICDDYAKTDDRIVVIHKQNEGVSKARNDALDRMRGDYCLFIDGDDWISEGFIKALYGQLIQEKADMVFANQILVKGEKCWNLYNYGQHRMFDRVEAVVDFLLYSASVAGRIYKKELFTNVRFPVGIKQAEDELVAFSLLLNLNKVCFCSDEAYYRSVRHGSASRSQGNENDIKAMQIRKQIVGLIQSNNLEVDDYVIVFMLRRYSQTLVKEAIDIDKIAFKKFLKEYRQWFRRGKWNRLESKGMALRYIILYISPGMYRMLQRILGR